MFNISKNLSTTTVITRSSGTSQVPYNTQGFN